MAKRNVTNNAELKDRKRAIPQLFEESPNELGIINYTAQYSLCRARHKVYFHEDVPTKTFLSARGWMLNAEVRARPGG
jgi:hypothetical protein